MAEVACSTRALMGAQPSGFGPVAKLTAIAEHLSGTERIFLGDRIALQFARSNKRSFDRIVECAPESLADKGSLIKTCDYGIVVMHHELAFWLAKMGIRFYLFDSLFGFWLTRQDVGSLAEIADAIQRLPPEEAHWLFDSLPVHERKLVAHFLAASSYVQNFPGVPDRAVGFRDFGARVHLMGSIVDLGPLATPRTSRKNERDVLVNLGGVSNFILEFGRNDYYVRLIEKWARAYLADDSTCSRLTICCGRYAEERRERINGKVLRLVSLGHNEFLDSLRRCDIYLMSPGLTSLHEAVGLGILPVVLPEQHYSQFYNASVLRQTGMADSMVRLVDIVQDITVPEHDYRGSAAIIDCAKQLLHSTELFQRFSTMLNRRISATTCMSRTARRTVLAKVARELEGADLTSVVESILADERARASVGAR